MNVYPNPAHDQLTINLKENSGSGHCANAGFERSCDKEFW
jgi:hypothetical protein